MVSNAQEWLESQEDCNTKEKREKITELNIRNEDLEGELNLNDFLSLETLYCYENNLTSLNLGNCSNLKELYCSENQLTQLILPKNSANLEELYCSDNQLTNLDFSSLNPEKLTLLDLRDNNFTTKDWDLSCFANFTQLKVLVIGTTDQEKINQGKHDRWVGSLEPLKNLTQLEELTISNTDLNSGLEYLPDSLEEFKCYTEERPTALSSQLIKELEVYGEPVEVYGEPGEYNNYTSLLTVWKQAWKWKQVGFSEAEKEQWLSIGLSLNELDFANYLTKLSLTPTEVKDKLSELRATYHSETKINTFLKTYQTELERIPYQQITNIEYLTKGGFGEIYRAEWNQQNVILKKLNNSQNITDEILQEIAKHRLFEADQVVKCYGISQDPQGNYIMVMDYAKGGNLRNYLQKNYHKLDLKKKLIQLHSIAQGLNTIHTKGLMHKDFHAGNILSNGTDNYFADLKCYITDLGLSKPANVTKESQAVYGVLPYVAPEVLRGNEYTQKSDIYSFGMIASEILSGIPPYHDEDWDDEQFVWDILEGKQQPELRVKVPSLLEDLIKSCWNINPEQRPTAEELLNSLSTWKEELNQSTSVIAQQVKEAEELNKSLPTLSLNFQVHPSAVYHSKLLSTTKQVIRPQGTRKEKLVNLSSDLTIVVPNLPEQKAKLETETKEQLITKLQQQLQEQTKQTNYWKEKYQQETTRLQQKITELETKIEIPPKK